MNAIRRWPHRLISADAPALAGLALVAWQIAGFLLRDDVFLYGDHPGHYWITWYTLNISEPLHHRLIDWIPYWYAGYPELQFTPPGYVFLASLLNVITFGRLATPSIYEIVAFIGYALPGLTFYVAVRHLRFERRAAFLAGLFALVFPAFFDGATGLFIGEIGSRIALALNALVLVWTIDWLEKRGTRYAWFAGLALAAVILAHPYHAIGVMLAVGLYAVVRRQPIAEAGIRLMIVAGPALALDAFWLAPLAAHSSTAMVPVIRATLDQTWRVITDGSLLPYALLAVPVVWRIARENDSARRAAMITLIGLPFLLGAAMLGTHVVLIDRLGSYQVDPVRMVGEYLLSLIWLAALGSSQIAEWISRLAVLRRLPAAVSAWTITLAVGAAIAVPYAQAANFYQPKPDDEPRFLSQAAVDYKLDELWSTLRATPGRVLFTSYSTSLNARRTEPFPTTLTALTPLFTGRPIIGGTYTAWSPIAAELWVGTPNPPVLWGLSQEQDDQSLFGVPLANLSDVQLEEYCTRFNITAIVASVNDYQARVFLDSTPRFQSYFNNGFFFVYKPTEIQPAWFDAENAQVDLVSMTDDQIVLRVRSAEDNARVGIKEYAYPTWRATTSTGQALPIARDDFALMSVAIPRGDDYSLTIRYEPGAAENIGLVISIASLMVFTAVGIIAMLRVQTRS